MTPRTHATAFAVAAAGLLLAGCLSGLGQRCDLDSDCRAGLICWSFTGTCERPCTDFSDCPSGLTCMCELDRPCPEVDDTAPVDDVEGGACIEWSADAGTDDEVVVDTTPDPDAVDTGVEPDLPDAPEVPDDCGSDGAPDVLPDGACVVPDDFPDPVLYMRTFRLGEDGQPGSGLDLDGNPSTCTPSDDCSGGVENGMFGLGSIANAYLPGGANGAETHVLLELAGFSVGGCRFTMNFYAGSLTTHYPSDCPADPVPVDCCPAGTACDFTIPADGFDAECLSLSTMGDLWAIGGDMRGGPTTAIYYLMLSVVGLDVLMPIHEARLEATVDETGGDVSAVQGIIGGYILESEFFAVFEAIPEEDYPFPGKDNVILLLHQLYDESLIINDRDTDGDTTPDAASIGIVFDADPATISGVDG
jgi:hypothetical protein